MICTTSVQSQTSVAAMVTTCSTSSAARKIVADRRARRLPRAIAEAMATVSSPKRMIAAPSSETPSTPASST